MCAPRLTGIRIWTLASTIEERLIKKAGEEGFAATGICGIGDIPEATQRLQAFLKAGFHGEMDWMERRAAWRGDPKRLWPAAQSVIMLAENYAPTDDPLKALDKKNEGCISVYAQNRDYHDIIKTRLKRLGRWLVEETGAQIKVFVDTAPVMEKPLAMAAGLGWQGKHTNLVSRHLGSWFFLGTIFTTARLKRSQPGQDSCGSCRRCLDICPTHAFPAPYQLDARRCISYLTIEHKGPVEDSLRPALGNRIFGCDDCLAVCPWNKFASTARDTRYQLRDDAPKPDLLDLVTLDDTTFRARFRGGPVRRIGRNRFVRNVLYAIGNSGNRSALSTVSLLQKDSDPVVADAAIWAARRLSAADQDI